MSDDLNPWDQQPGETNVAYRAFVVYRDMGAGRSIDAVARELNRSGQRGSNKRAAGRFNAWSGFHRWVERARSWDAHQDREHQRAIIEATRREADEWARRRTQEHEAEYRVGQLILGRAAKAAGAPADEAPDPFALRAAAIAAEKGANLTRTAIDRALGLDRPASGASTPGVADRDDEEDDDGDPATINAAFDEAARLIAERRAELVGLRRRLGIVGVEPGPGTAGDDGAATPPPQSIA